MQSLKFKGLRFISQGLITLLFLGVSFYSHSQVLTAGLSLRIGPSVGFPYSIELPSGSDISIIQRRDDWLLIQDERGEIGWALLTEIDKAGGLPDRQAWRLKELKKSVSGQLRGQLFTNKSGQGWGLGWAYPFMAYQLSSEYQQSNNFDAKWQSFSAWMTADESINRNIVYRYGFGLGYGIENEASHVLSSEGESDDSAYFGGEVSIAFIPNQEFESGLQMRYLLTDLQGRYSSYQVSWYWAVGI